MLIDPSKLPAGWNYDGELLIVPDGYSVPDVLAMFLVFTAARFVLTASGIVVKSPFTHPQKGNEMSNFRIKLGAEVVEMVTGFKGIVTGRAEYIAGCRQYSVMPRAKADGSLTNGEWFDEERLTTTGVIMTLPSSPSGGPSRSEAPPAR